MKFHPYALARYHRSPLRPVKIVVVDNGASSDNDMTQVVVYVDPEGHPIETFTRAVRVVPSPTPAPSSADIKIADAPPAKPSPSPSPGAELTAVSSDARERPPPPPIPPKSGIDGTTNLKQDTESTKNETGSLLSGVTYSPYNSDGSCKTAAEVASGFQTLAPLYSLVRIYGVDCNQVATVLSAVHQSASANPSSSPLRLFLGIFNLDDLDSQVTTLVDAVTDKTNNPSGWDVVDTISVGNELVNNGQATPQQVLNAVSAARTSFRSAGYTGPVVTVDTFIAVTQNPSLCDKSDYCAMNIHPFFDPNTRPDQAGDFVVSQVANVRSLLTNPNQRIVVTESGWPWQGIANGKAVPGKQNQETAVNSIVGRFGEVEGLENLVLFTAFNDGWKKAEAVTFYAEQFWGMH